MNQLALMMCRRKWIVYAIFCSFPIGVTRILVYGTVESDGVCPLLVFLPYTTSFYNESGALQAVPYEGVDTIGGFSFMAAALLAIDHFNSRNTSVVPELTGLTSGCNVTLHIDRTSFVDDGSLARVASQRLFQAQRKESPCVIVGPFNDFPALDLATMAQASATPNVVCRAYNARVTSNFFSRYSSSVWPDTYASASNIVGFLRSKGRTNYTSFLYSLSDTNYQRRENLGVHLGLQDIEFYSSAYLSSFAQGYSLSTLKLTAYDALTSVKKRGFRTIIVGMAEPYEITDLADAAERLGMNNGDYMWIWYDIFNYRVELTPNVCRLMHGSFWIVPLSSAEIEQMTSPFMSAWKSQTTDQVDRLNQFNPIEPMSPGYAFANRDFFLQTQPELGSAYLYDAIMTAGIGTCRALRMGSDFTGELQVDAIRGLKFEGATGQVQFGNAEQDPDRLGTRLASTVTFGAYNVRIEEVLPGNLSSSIVLTDLLLPGRKSHQWNMTQDSIYGGGRTLPPLLLRDDPEKNYLSPHLQALGLSLMAFAAAASVACGLWVFVYRKHRVLKASQPPFLYLACFGALAQALAIFTISFDESDGWTEDQLGAACMAMPWLLALGTILVYGALFSKLYRLNKVLKVSRHKITMKTVAWPMSFLALLVVLVLILWTILNPLTWERPVIDDTTGESIGQCGSDGPQILGTILIVIAIIPTVMTGFVAWKTRDIDEKYSESSWIFLLIMVQLEIMIIAFPVIAILRGVSTDGRYLGTTLMIWSFPTSTLLIIMLPKVIAWRRAVRGLDSSQQVKRGQHLGTRVSGINLTTCMGATGTSLKCSACGASIASATGESHINPI